MAEHLDLPALLATAESVVDEAEKIFVRGLGADPTLFKGPGDFATQVDLDIELLFRDVLTDRTGIGLYGEESGGVIGTDPVWVVDPVDGTTNYASGNPLCSILVSLLVNKEPVLAITSLPIMRRRVSAQRGCGIWVNGVRPECPHPASSSHQPRPQVGFSSVGAPRSSLFPNPLQRGFARGVPRSKMKPRITGSIGVDLGFTALGIFGGAVSFSSHVWDNASGVLLVQEAGGVVTDPQGQPWKPGVAGVIAGTPAVHELLMSTMNHGCEPSSEAAGAEG